MEGDIIQKQSQLFVNKYHNDLKTSLPSIGAFFHVSKQSAIQSTMPYLQETSTVTYEGQAVVGRDIIAPALQVGRMTTSRLFLSLGFTPAGSHCGYGKHGNFQCWRTTNRCVHSHIRTWKNEGSFWLNLLFTSIPIIIRLSTGRVSFLAARCILFFSDFVYPLHWEHEKYTSKWAILIGVFT